MHGAGRRGQGKQASEGVPFGSFFLVKPRGIGFGAVPKFATPPKRVCKYAFGTLNIGRLRCP